MAKHAWYIYIYVNICPSFVSMDGEAVWGMGVYGSSLGKGPTRGSGKGSSHIWDLPQSFEYNRLLKIPS